MAIGLRNKLCVEDFGLDNEFSIVSFGLRDKLCVEGFGLGLELAIVFIGHSKNIIGIEQYQQEGEKTKHRNGVEF